MVGLIRELRLAERSLRRDPLFSITQCMRASLAVDVADALEVQAVHAAEFLAGPVCAEGAVGGAAEWPPAGAGRRGLSGIGAG